jgi:hypothetical protein
MYEPSVGFEQKKRIPPKIKIKNRISPVFLFWEY